jgi:ornithine lipid ester-linked acyl 2-hydroxylase
MNLWFSIIDEQTYYGNEPSFYNPENYSWAKYILDHKEIIIQEFYKVLNTNNLFNPYFNHILTTKQNTWTTIGLKFWSINNYKNQFYFPQTTQLINSIPCLVSASFNKLSAMSSIEPHCGDTNGIFRCHLGIEIPGELPDCGFEVNNQQKSWGNNQLLIFCDAHKHKAWNNTQKDRYIFLFDIIREEYIPQKNKVISTVLSSLFIQKILLLLIRCGINPNLFDEHSFKRKKLKPFVALLKPFALLAVWFVNKFKIY